MTVRPRTGLVIRDPVTLRELPAAGGEVPDSTFWRRRLRDGDVVLVEQRGPDVLEAPIAPLITRRP